MKILSAFLIMVPATILLTAEASLAEPAAEACKPSPTGAAPRGAHWYFHVNRTTKQHCWYLGQAGGRVRSQARLTTTADPLAAARPADVADADAAAAQSASAVPAPTQSAAADDGPAVPARALQAAQPQTASPPIASPQTAGAQTAGAQTADPQAAAAPATTTAQPAVGNRAGSEQFGARWPENLPKTEDLLQGDPAPASDSYADRSDLTPTGQMPSKSPMAQAAGAAGNSVGARVLHYFTIAGILAIPLLLLAGWLAQYARRPLRADPRQPVPSTAQRQRRRAASGEAEFAEPEAERRPVVRRRIDSDRNARVLTDPAHDLKASLSELMSDLRRAGEPDVPPRRTAARPDGWVQEPLREEPLREEPLREEPLRQEPVHREHLRRGHLQDHLDDGDDHRALARYLEAAE